MFNRSESPNHASSVPAAGATAPTGAIQMKAALRQGADFEAQSSMLAPVQRVAQPGPGIATNDVPPTAAAQVQRRQARGVHRVSGPVQMDVDGDVEKNLGKTLEAEEAALNKPKKGSGKKVGKPKDQTVQVQSGGETVFLHLRFFGERTATGGQVLVSVGKDDIIGSADFEVDEAGAPRFTDCTKPVTVKGGGTAIECTPVPPDNSKLPGASAEAALFKRTNPIMITIGKIWSLISQTIGPSEEEDAAEAKKGAPAHAGPRA